MRPTRWLIQGETVDEPRLKGPGLKNTIIPELVTSDVYHGVGGVDRAAERGTQGERHSSNPQLR